MYYLLTCRSLTYAQRSQRALERGGITATITRAPSELNTDGCGYCLRVAGGRLSDSVRLLAAESLRPKKAYSVDASGVITEVAF